MLPEWKIVKDKYGRKEYVRTKYKKDKEGYNTGVEV